MIFLGYPYFAETETQKLGRRLFRGIFKKKSSRSKTQNGNYFTEANQIFYGPNFYKLQNLGHKIFGLLP